MKKREKKNLMRKKLRYEIYFTIFDQKLSRFFNSRINLRFRSFDAFELSRDWVTWSWRSPWSWQRFFRAVSDDSNILRIPLTLSSFNRWTRWLFFDRCSKTPVRVSHWCIYRTERLGNEFGSSLKTRNDSSVKLFHETSNSSNFKHPFKTLNRSVTPWRFSTFLYS